MLSNLERSSENLLLDPVYTKTKHSSTPNCWQLRLPIDSSWDLKLKRILVASTPSEEICFQVSCSTISSFTSERTRTRGPPDVLSPSTWVVKESVLIPKKGPRRKIKHRWFWSDYLVTELAKKPLPEVQTYMNKPKRALFIIPKYVHILYLVLKAGGAILVRST